MDREAAKALQRGILRTGADWERRAQPRDLRRNGRKLRLIRAGRDDVAVEAPAAASAGVLAAAREGGTIGTRTVGGVPNAGGATANCGHTFRRGADSIWLVSSTFEPEYVVPPRA